MKIRTTFHVLNLFTFISLFFLILILTPHNLYAKNLTGRLGIGMNNQFANDVPAISFKMQRSSIYAMNLLMAAKIADSTGGYGAGLKIYRVLFDEPLLLNHLCLQA